MSKTIIAVTVTIILLALAFVVTVLIMGSIHDLSFVEEIKSWFDSSEETVEPVINMGTEAIVNFLRI